MSFPYMVIIMAVVIVAGYDLGCPKTTLRLSQSD